MDSKAVELLSQAETLADKFEQGGGTNYINEAIDLDREALELCPPGNPERSICLNNLAIHLWNRQKELGEMTDTEEAIALDREALALRPPGHPDRSMSLINLAVGLSSRYDQLGVMADLEEAIVLGRDVLAICAPGHTNRSMSLSNLAADLSTRYKQLGKLDDLNEAIDLQRDALALRPQGHPARSGSLNNLAAHLAARYEQLGSIEDLNEAIIFDRDALALRPPGHPLRPRSLNNLALRLCTRYRQLGTMEDLEEAISLNRDALALYPYRHPSRILPLTNLAMYLSTRYEQLRVMEDLSDAISLDREVLALRAPEHPDRSTALNNLAVRLTMRYNRLGEIGDLDEAIVLERDALALCPPGHPDRPMSLNNLAIHLCSRNQHLGKLEDLDEAIALSRDALESRPLGHPNRSKSLSSLMRCLAARYEQTGEVKDREALFAHGSELTNIQHTVSSSDLLAANSWVKCAEYYHHPTTLLAYKTTLRLLVQHLATLPSLPQHLDVLKNLASSLAVDAFSAGLRNQSPTTAVELLEQGRGIFWSQLARLRSPLDDVIASGPAGAKLADEFSRLTSHIRNTLNVPDTDQHNRVFSLNVQLQSVVTEIRGLPELSRFLLPSLFPDLQKAARDGPVIILNASTYSCDALVVLIDRDPVHIPLSMTKANVRQLSSELRTLTVRAKTMNVTKEFGRLLRDLWDDVVSHVVEFLLTIHPHQSRIWWCPTAEFSLLPLHAAGPYRKGQKNLADIYISSYTPTLTALIRARHHSLKSASSGERFLAIGQANASGEAELASVGSELANIGQCVDGLTTFTCIEGPDSSIARVAEELGKSDWVHLACHGIPDRQHPFESAFALRDGRFTIQRIIQCELQNPEFAYLSACHTTVGDEESPDEVIHLASAMQFAGFRSVIGTMWAVDDGETNKITSLFYDNIKDESGRLDHTRAALALNRTMKKVGNIPFDQRVLYIHLGA